MDGETHSRRGGSRSALNFVEWLTAHALLSAGWNYRQVLRRLDKPGLTHPALWSAMSEGLHHLQDGRLMIHHRPRRRYGRFQDHRGEE